MPRGLSLLPASPVCLRLPPTLQLSSVSSWGLAPGQFGAWGMLWWREQAGGTAQVRDSGNVLRQNSKLELSVRCQGASVELARGVGYK